MSMQVILVFFFSAACKTVTFFFGPFLSPPTRVVALKVMLRVLCHLLLLLDERKRASPGVR